MVLAKPNKHEDNNQQAIGLRIWNNDKSAILLYLSKKSATWSLPSIRTTPERGIINSLFLLLDQFVEMDLSSAICILDIKDIIPIQQPGFVTNTDISFQYIVYNAVFNVHYVTKIKLPDNTKSSHFVTTKGLSELVYKTPMLNHLISYMKENENQSLK